MRRKIWLGLGVACVLQLGFFSCEDGGGFIIDKVKHPVGYVMETDDQPDAWF